MLRKLVVFLMIIVGYLLQTTLFKAISLAGIVPNLLLIITSSFGFMRGRNEGMVIGFTAGLLVDVFFGSILGFYAFVYMFIGFLNGFFRRIFYPEDIKLPMILIGTSELLYCFICYTFLFLLRGKMHLGYYFVHIMLPDIVYTVLVTLIVYKGILFVNEWLEEYEKRRA
ncbi:MAG: rod shape-determining protein MreD [Lachnospiraceae bacterium]|nr:rod shape-determining protein MreD [Lachnospiraceae bacterium]